MDHRAAGEGFVYKILPPIYAGLVRKTLKIIFTGLLITNRCSDRNRKAVENSALIISLRKPWVVVVLVAVMFFLVKLEITSEQRKPILQITARHQGSKQNGYPKPLILQQRHFVMAVVSKFFACVSAGIGSFFVNYTIETKILGIGGKCRLDFCWDLVGMVLFCHGRFLGSFHALLKADHYCWALLPSKHLLMFVTAIRHDNLGIIALILSYLFMSHHVSVNITGHNPDWVSKPKQTSSLMMMTIVEGCCPHRWDW